MKIKISLGDKVGLLKILDRKKINGSFHFIYKCDCGNEGTRLTSSIYRALRNNSKIDCGCRRRNVSIGDKFGRLVVVEKIPNYIQGGKIRGFWKLKCECGNYTNSTTDLLFSGKKISCGCAQIENYNRGVTQICYLWKTCPNCNNEKWHTEFVKDGKRKGGLKSFCRKCDYISKDKSKIATSNFIRKKRLRQSVPKVLDKKELDKIHQVKYELQELLDVELNVDHIYPVQHKIFCGLTIPINLQITTMSYNTGKGNRIESIDFDVLSEGSIFYKGVRIHKSVAKLMVNIKP